jgi:HEAT repeat protein
MNKPMPQNSGKSAAELMQQLQNDPTYKEKMDAKEQQRMAVQAAFNREERLILEMLLSAGYDVASLDELRRSCMEYKSALPILLHWLTATANVSVKEAIVRTLSVPWAKPVATPVLLAEFKRAAGIGNTFLQWSIANALEVLADDSFAQEMIDIACDKRYGKAREMVVLALAKIADPRAKAALETLLGDEQIAGHAVLALSRGSNSINDAKLRPFLNHPQAWVREAAKKALAGRCVKLDS